MRYEFKETKKLTGGSKQGAGSGPAGGGGSGGAKPRKRAMQQSGRTAQGAKTVQGRQAKPASAGGVRPKQAARSKQAGHSKQAGAGAQHGTSGRPRYSASTQRAAQSHPTRRTAGRPARRRPPRRGAKRRVSIPLPLIGAGIVLLVALGIYLHWDFTRPITVYVNGTEVEITERTVQAAFEAAGSPAHAGDLYDIEGELLEEEGGGEIVVAVNNKVSSFDKKVSEGDELVFMNGDDTEEPSVTLEDQEIEPEIIEEGTGAIYTVVQEPQAGAGTVQYGTVSGKTIVLEVEQEAVDGIYLRWTPDTGDDKVIALTFDDGPHSTYTEQILDILAEYGVKATFFTIGEQITGTGAELVLREYEEGHQVCTHTWDHASGSGNGVNLSYMTEEEQREEVTQGIQAIADAIGTEASTVMRAPGGNFPIEVWRNVEDLISAQITWTIDTEDWSQPGTSSIIASIESARSGDIVLMHDGGGNRSQTVEALKTALPYLISQGYTFVTIDELMEYPAKES